MPEAIPAIREPEVAHLIELAIKGLRSMYDPDRGLFCYRLKKTASGVARENISHRYTIMTLLGLLRAETAGLQSPINIEATIDRLLYQTAWIDNIGDLGLMLWLCAATPQKRLNQFCSTLDLSGALERFPDARQRLTMHLSWFLTGLALASQAEQFADQKLLADETYRLLRANQGPHGLFGHMAKWCSLAGVVRGRVGSFADQVYPILAMAYFSHVFHNSEARDNSLRCARAICNLQGALGQWWWHYDSVTGRVVEHYPVYSVHQHGMAPMALLALDEVCAADFQSPIHNGLRWLFGSNELHRDLKDSDMGVAWRCIRPSKSASFAARVRTLVVGKPPRCPLHILYECRPYELGWLLYAFAQPGCTTMQ